MYKKDHIEIALNTVMQGDNALNIDYLAFSDKFFKDDVTSYYNVGIVRAILPKNSTSYIDLASKVAFKLNNKFVTYDFVTKALARLLSLSNINTFLMMMELSIMVNTNKKVTSK